MSVIKNASITFLFVLFLYCGLSLNTLAQVGENNLLCPSVPFEEGMLQFEVSPASSGAADFTGGMVGTIQRINGRVSGGIDWMHSVDTPGSSSRANTNEFGSQLISWWSRTDSRSTKIQVTNNSDNSAEHTTGTVLDVHVQIFDKNCLEVIDFCDEYTPFDTHVYDLESIVTNSGAIIGSAALMEKEGLIVVTAVDNCMSPGRAIDHNFLSGNMYVSDSLEYTYASNMFARKAVCRAPGCTGILDGSEGSRLQKHQPSQIYGLFDTIAPPAGSDAVVMNFKDQYTPSYLATPGISLYVVGIFDHDENLHSCGEAVVCFMRLGIDNALPAREDLGPPFTP